MARYLCILSVVAFAFLSAVLAWHVLDLSVHLDHRRQAASELNHDLEAVVKALNGSMEFDSTLAARMALAFEKEKLHRLYLCRQAGRVWIESYDWIEVTSPTCTSPPPSAKEGE